MTDALPDRRPTRGSIIAAFAAVYVIWGSTYLAIRIAIETLPPFLMASARFLVAGGLLYAWSRIRGAERPTAANWLAALTVGGLLLMGGNGAVVWAEQRVASGVAALLVATVPLWMVLLDWWWRGGARPGRGVIAGIALGLAGLVLLVGPGTIAGGGRVDPAGAAVLVLGSFSWAAGSLYSQRAPLPKAPLLATSMEMLGGGLLLFFAGLLTREGSRLDLGAVSLQSVMALLYLVIFGSLVAFTAYIWLLRVSTPARVSTYAYVNPVVAVLLGWAFAGEPITARTLLAAAIIVGAVALITTTRTTVGAKATDASRAARGELARTTGAARPVDRRRTARATAPGRTSAAGELQ
jgi:drug/metabolite transporter (DMT)-like permease